MFDIGLSIYIVYRIYIYGIWLAITYIADVSHWLSWLCSLRSLGVADIFIVGWKL